MTSSSHILVLGSNSVHSLVPSTLISQLESLLESHRLEEAFNVVDTRRKKLEESLEVDEDETEELQFLYQRLGFQYLTETLFEDAGNSLFNGKLDPRVLISYFPELRGSLFSDEDHVNVFAGIAEKMPSESSVEEIIRNYSPHLPPNTRSAPPTAELRRILQDRALQMLETFLKKERRRRIALDLDQEEFEQAEARAHDTGKGKGKEIPQSIRAVIDTVLAKIYAKKEKTTDLYDLLASPNSVVLAEVEDVFRQTGQYNALCILYQQGGEKNDERLLETWAKLVEGEWTDTDIPDPLLQMISLLMTKRDSALTQKWALWLTKRDPDAGIRVLTTLREAAHTTGGKRRERDKVTAEEDLALLQQIETANPAAGKQYLEYLVLQRRTHTKDLHNRLALSCIEEVLNFLRQDDTVTKLWRAKASSYASPGLKSQKAPPSSSSVTHPSFFSHFASTTPESPSKRSRLRCIIFLAGSHFYDPSMIRDRIVGEGRDKILALEMAVLEGKLRNHRSALTILCRDLNDATSAEAYCTLGGDVIPSKVAVSVAEGAGLAQWVESLFPTAPSKMAKSTSSQSAGKPKPSANHKQPVDEKRDLLKLLLEVYMTDDSPTSSEHAAQLLNTQAMNLDVLDVMALVPPSWPLPFLSSFLARSFRRITNSTREGQIMKNISSGQNLETKEKTWERLREEGALIEEEADEEYDEKDEVLHKVANIVLDVGEQNRSAADPEKWSGSGSEVTTDDSGVLR